MTNSFISYDSYTAIKHEVERLKAVLDEEIHDSASLVERAAYNGRKMGYTEVMLFISGQALTSFRQGNGVTKPDLYLTNRDKIDKLILGLVEMQLYEPLPGLAEAKLLADELLQSLRLTPL